jgi:hypothetical protein
MNKCGGIPSLEVDLYRMMDSQSDFSPLWFYLWSLVSKSLTCRSNPPPPPINCIEIKLLNQWEPAC